MVIDRAEAPVKLSVFEEERRDRTEYDFDVFDGIWQRDEIPEIIRHAEFAAVEHVVSPVIVHDLLSMCVVDD